MKLFPLSSLRRPLVRQILGAAGGALVALVLYAAAGFVLPRAQSVLHGSAPAGDRLEEVAERARSLIAEGR